MRSRVRPIALALAGGAALAALYPALAQRAPESILPPGFGDPPAPSPAPTKSGAPKPATKGDEPPAATPTTPTDVPDVALKTPGTNEIVADETAGLDNALSNTIEPTVLQDLPAAARRSLDQVGLLASADGGLGPDTFGAADGRYLSSLMRGARAPFASRWASILLRRALLSQSRIPANIGGADWVAHRAWLLVRMGEADNARSLVQRVDSENYTPWLYDIAMQAALATADPGAVCGIADDAAVVSDRASWILARAMCAGLSGEGGTAASLVARARGSGRAGGIDVLLAEKVAGAGTNTRRAVNIQWDGVEHLTAWRFGLAAATGVTVPDTLFAKVGPQVQAWAARAPLYEPAARLGFADRAATLGVFSSAALVDLYGSVYDAADPADRGALTATTLRSAYTGDASARLSALRSLWASGGNANADYARLILTARAAATLPADTLSDGADRDRAIAAMMAAGLDIQAARLAGSVGTGSLGWALLAVGAPRPPFAISGSGVRSFASADSDALRGQFLFAALAGLGRLPTGEVESLARELAVPVGRQNSWTRALDRAVAARERGTVALLAAIGMQTSGWGTVPPEHLFRIVDSLRRVGLEPEARMIAAEALTRS